MADITHHFDDPAAIIIQVSGELREGDASALEAYADRLTAQAPRREGSDDVCVSFNSRGGNFLEGIAIGKLLWDRGYGSLVARGAECYSAAAFAFLGGAFHYAVGGSGPQRTVEAGAQVGFHGFYVDSGRSVTERFGVHTGKYLATILADYALSVQVDMRFMIDSLQKQPHEHIMLRTAGQFARLRIGVSGLAPITNLTEQRAVYAANSATGWERPISLTPRSGETLATVEKITAGEYKHLIVNTVSEALRRPRRVTYEPGLIGKAIHATAAMTDADEFDAAYAELERFGIVPAVGPKDTDVIYRVAGFEFGGGFYTKECFVQSKRDGSPKISVSVVCMTPADMVSDIVHVGDFGLRPPDEVLW